MNQIQSNLHKENLKGHQIGVFFGTFAPLHVGHLAEIYKAAALNDGVVVVVSGYPGDRGDKMGLSLEKRFRYLREAFNDEPQIKVAMLDETDMPKMPDGWDVWLTQLLKLVKANIVDDQAFITFYTGEEEYQNQIQTRLPQTDQFKVSLMDRTILNISGTEIRENPLKNWDYINRVFRRHFVKKVTVMGAANTGKSTLVRRLARTANSPFSDEYMKIYQEESNVSNQELDVRDYINIINGQFNVNAKEISSPSNNGIAFFDTDAINIWTEAQANLSQQDLQKLKVVVDTTVAAQEFDVILIEPGDDSFNQRLISNLEEYKLSDKIHLLDAKGDANDQYGYYARYLQAIEIISKYTGFEIKTAE